MPMCPEEVEVLYTPEEISRQVRVLAGEISADYEGEDLLLVALLKGAFMFLADLVRELEVPVELDFVGLSSYGEGTVSSGEIRVVKDLTAPVEGRHVLVVEDIVDTGLSLRYILTILKARNPRSIRVCALLDKPKRREVPVPIDYVGFSVPDRFLVGYGLDYAEKYRQLPFVGILESDSPPDSA